VAALLIALIPRNYRFVIRIVSVTASLISLVLGVAMFAAFVPGGTGFQFAQRVPWVESLGISYYVGVDGINVGLVLLGTIVAFAATAISWDIKDRQKEFYLLLMVMIGGILGAFASLDLFFLYFFHELALIPTFIMIGVWGRGENKNYAAYNITLYLTAGALLTLIGLIALYVASGANTFSIPELTAALSARPLSSNLQQLIFPILLFGFGILVSLWPFHTWAPLGYGAAPAATAMLHAGVLKKFGLYGLIRVALPMLPEGAQSWMQILAVLCLGNILFSGLVAMQQRNLNLLIGNSSVAHMGFVFLGIASLTLIGITGAVVVMIAHGLLAALSFAISGYLYQQTGTLNLDSYGGFLRRLPFMGTVTIMMVMAGCGLPAFANFVGEAMAMFGAWKAHPVVTTLAAWGALVIAAVYMLGLARSAMHGPMVELGNNLQDAPGLWRKLPFALLVAGLLIFGCVPRLLTDRIAPSAEKIVQLTTGQKSPNLRTAESSAPAGTRFTVVAQP